MKYERFEDLPVWKAAIELAVGVFELTSRENFKGHGGLRDQIERAAVSVSNNIAEGFERGTTQELLTFIYIARGSAAETRSMLLLLDRLAAFSSLKAEIATLRPLAESVSRQLRGWAGLLQNSEIKGQRYLTDKTRVSTRAAREREEFIEQLRQAQDENLARIQRGNASPHSTADCDD
ncbi:MAG: four helix bundle protein [Blastocatellia bacterium]